jgi:hypothetical protein
MAADAIITFIEILRTRSWRPVGTTLSPVVSPRENDVAIIAAHDTIDSANEGGRAAKTIKIFDHINLVRHGAVKTDPTHRAGTAHGIAKCLWGYVTIEVTRVDVVVFISSLDHRHNRILSRQGGERPGDHA